MEPAKIDWKRIDSRFEEDHVYEHINAPKWVDFLNPTAVNELSPDDVAWFCRPDCNHPKSVEDFLKKTPPASTKVRSSAGVNETPSHGYSNLRDPNLKRSGGQGQQKEDLENLNPNMSTPPPSKPAMAAFKCSSEKRKPRDDSGLPGKEEAPRLRTTMSARNLFAGRDILNHITEFCNELKKLATRAKQKESNEEKMKEKRKKNDNQEGTPQASSGAVLRDLNDKQRKSRVENVRVGKVIENQSQKLSEETENVRPLLNLENVKRRGGEQLLQIRTNPPSPQCFSAPRGSIKTTPPKATQSRLGERGVLQELKPIQEVNAKAAGATTNASSVVAGREGAAALDMFWFLKPCTVSD